MTKRAEKADYCWITIKLSAAKRRTQLRARCLLIENGLAIAERDGGLYSITHIATGLCIGSDRLTESKAREVIAKLIPLTDWSGENSHRVSLRKLRSIGAIIKDRTVIGWK